MGKVEESIVVQASPEACYRAWRDFDTFPQFMPGVLEVERVPPEEAGGEVWQWQVKGPFGDVLAWRARLDIALPGKALSWHTVAGSGVDGSGAVNFVPQREDVTRIDVKMTVIPPGGVVGSLVSKLIRYPHRMVRTALRAFQTRMESGNLYSVSPSTASLEEMIRQRRFSP